MAFNSINKQFRTAADLRGWLASQPVPDWPGENPRGSTLHNTYRPTEMQWLGLKSMQSMQAGYVAKGWTSGPHFYLALGSPNPANDGIWCMTPPTSPGTHGVTCNVSHFGVEVVGDFQKKAPSLPQQVLILDTLVALHRWAGLGPLLNAHRDCVKRTCPGDAFYAIIPGLRAQFAARLAGAGKYAVRHTQAIFEAPRPDAPVALADTARIIEGQVIDIDEVKLGWGHLASAVGFVPMGVLSKA